jgi:predicted dehydrogenase
LGYNIQHAQFPQVFMNSPAPQVAVLGTGSIGLRHLRVLNEFLHVPAAAIPVRAGRKQELQEMGFGVCETLEEAVDRGAGLIVVATDTGRHIADAWKAVSLNCDVLVEKPLAPSTTRLAELASLAREKCRIIYVGCSLRFDRSLLSFRERLPEVGSLHSVRIECQSYLPDWRPERDYRHTYAARANEGGVLLDLVHEIDYATWLFGRPSGIFARLGNMGRLSIQAEETADLYWETPSGTHLSIRLDYVTRRPHRILRAYGEYGEIVWDGREQSVTLTMGSQEPNEEVLPQLRDEIIRDQAQAFLTGAAGGPTGTLATFEEGAAAVSICDTARRSSASGRIETVSNWRLN